jgi:quercetin dioxygenase-like cupin family protein
MAEFPEFMRNPQNAIDPAMQSEGVEGYVYDGAGGSQMAFWTTSKSGKSSEHVHDFDEYLVIIQGECTLIIDEERITLRPGEEYHIRAGLPHATEFAAGTRSIHAFGGQRAKRKE